VFLLDGYTNIVVARGCIQVSIVSSHFLLHGTGLYAPQLTSVYACCLQFSRLSPALTSALLWIMPAFGRFEGMNTTSWHTTTPQWTSCRYVDRYLHERACRTTLLPSVFGSRQPEQPSSRRTWREVSYLWESFDRAMNVYERT
jgi:hypothetical protein